MDKEIQPELPLDDLLLFLCSESSRAASKELVTIWQNFGNGFGDEFEQEIAGDYRRLIHQILRIYNKHSIFDRDLKCLEQGRSIYPKVFKTK